MRGTMFELTQEVHVCGRSCHRCDVQINDPSVSGMHCNFVRRMASYYVFDLGSTNGTRVNNVPISEETPLKNGDIVTVGVVEMMFQTSEKSTQRCSVLGRTGIDLRRFVTSNPTDTSVARIIDVSKMDNMSPFFRRDRNAKIKRILPLVIIAVLTALVVALTVYLVCFVRSQGVPSTTPAPVLMR